MILALKNVISTIDRKYFNESRRTKYFAEFFSNIPKPISKKGLNVIIYSGIPNMYLSPFEMLMYHYLKVKGCNVKLYIYGPEARCHELVTAANSLDKAGFVSRNYKRGTKLLKAAGIEFEHIKVPEALSIREIIENLQTIDEVFDFKYDNVSLGPVVRRVVYRYYKSLSIEDKSDALEVAKCFMKTALENYLFFASKAQGIDVVLMSHGIYCTWEPVLQYAKVNQIKAVVYDRAKTASTININFNQPSPDWSFNAAWEEYKYRNLSFTEEDRVDAYLVDRELQKNDVFAYNFKAKSGDSAAVREKLGLKMSDKVIVFFTNLVWDAANVDRDEVFEGFDQAIIKTAGKFKNRPDVKVMVRTHPAERVLGTNLRFQDMLPIGTGEINVIDENLEINSFDIIAMADIGVVHTSTIGLEMAMLAKPVFVLGNTHYKHKEFTYDPLSIDEYFSKIQDLIEGDSGFEAKKAYVQKLARKYFYMMMFLYQHKLPLRYKNNEFDVFEHVSFNELFEQNNKVRELVDCMLDSSSKHFITWNKDE